MGLLAMTCAGRAAAETTPIVVFFDASASDLPQSEIRAAVGRELQRAVRADADPSAPALTIGRSEDGQLVVRYRGAQADLEKKIAVPPEPTPAAQTIALAARSLITGETPDASAVQTPTARRAPPSEVATRVGFYARVAVAAGYGDAIYTNRAAASWSPTTTLTYEAGVIGPNLGLHLAAGHMFTSGVAFGGELGAQVSGPLYQQGNLADAKIGPFSARLQIGPFVDYYPYPGARLHLLAGLAVARSFFQYAVPVSDATSGVVVRPLWGGLGYLGAGWDLGARPGGAGLFARTYLGYFADEGSSLRPLELILGASVAWF
jgi:hypothetical protein